MSLAILSEKEQNLWHFVRSVVPNWPQVRQHAQPAALRRDRQHHQQRRLRRRYVPPINTQEAAGFISSLFDLSFSSFITPKLIKVLFVISIVLAAFWIARVVMSGFQVGGVFGGTGALLIVAPIIFFFYVMYARVIMEVLIVIFRCSEYLAEIAKQGRR